LPSELRAGNKEAHSKGKPETHKEDLEEKEAARAECEGLEMGKCRPVASWSPFGKLAGELASSPKLRPATPSGR